MRILNLGCGTTASPDPAVLNIDWSPYLRLRKNRILRGAAPLVLHDQRLVRFRSLPDNILARDLTRRLPFADDSIDVVYHSHLLEHFDLWVAERFLGEVRRVLKPGGVQRIAVPDMEQACASYLRHISLCDADPAEARNHDRFVAAIIEQCARRQARGTSGQEPFRRFLENLLLGDARRRGETHQWMYDRINLPVLLLRNGFTNPRLHSFATSSIPSWSRHGLDADEGGAERHPGSLYMEVEK